jgi:hypothetical protein
VRGLPRFAGGCNAGPGCRSLESDVALHLLEVKAYRSRMIALRHEVRRDA